eukprot:SAG25_NODE_154_length_13563_cov_44.588978_13_plen_72_part_00
MGAGCACCTHASQKRRERERGVPSYTLFVRVAAVLAGLAHRAMTSTATAADYRRQIISISPYSISLQRVTP